MSIIVALFLGLTISAEEIFHDRKILKREQFLNLSRNGYLLAKILLLLGISALQSFLFILVANSILEIRGMFFNYWLALFATAVMCKHVRTDNFLLVQFGDNNLHCHSSPDNTNDGPERCHVLI